MMTRARAQAITISAHTTIVFFPQKAIYVKHIDNR